MEVNYNVLVEAASTSAYDVMITKMQEHLEIPGNEVSVIMDNGSKATFSDKEELNTWLEKCFGKSGAEEGEAE